MVLCGLLVFQNMKGCFLIVSAVLEPRVQSKFSIVSDLGFTKQGITQSAFKEKCQLPGPSEFFPWRC